MSKRASRNRKRFGYIEASASPKTFAICGESEPMELLAAGDNEPANKPKKFAMVAYTGAAMQVGYGYPVVVDLAGGDPPRQSTPIFRNHDPDRIVGHTNTVEVTAQRIKVSGVMSGDPEQVDPIVASAGRGFPWQASIGAKVGKLEFVEPGQKVKVNGRVFDGPVYVARQWTLGEISFVPIGADTSTSASVAASQQVGVAPMDENLAKRLKADGFDPATLSQEAVANMKAMYAMKDAPKETPAPAPVAAKLEAAGAGGDDVMAQRRNSAAETLRIRAIRRLAAEHGEHEVEVERDGQKVTVDLEAHCIDAGIDEGKAEVHFVRAAMRKATAKTKTVRTEPQTAIPGEVLEAGLCMSRGLPDLEKKFKPEVLEAAHKDYRHLGLQELILRAAASNGYSVGPGKKISSGNIREVMHAAFGGIRASGFSTVPLPNILGNVANKELLAGYMEEDQSWREIAGIKSVSNFHAITSYRMLDDMSYEKLGPAGEIKHGKVSEESYTRQADTYAKMFSLTRRDIINDDMGAFDDLRGRLGRGSAQAFNDAFWTEFLSDASTFWTTARTNYITGATTNLGTDGVGLGLGVKAFRQMTSPTADGAKRIAGRPEILLVPPELEQIADALFVARNDGSVKVSDVNTHTNKYRPVVSAWLSDANYTGYSTTAWYLLRSPAVAPAIVVSFLNGMQTPTVESAEADFNTLGIQFRGYHDWGCDQAEYLAGIKSKGAT